MVELKVVAAEAVAAAVAAELKVVVAEAVAAAEAMSAPMASCMWPGYHSGVGGQSSKPSSSPSTSSASC